MSQQSDHHLSTMNNGSIVPQKENDKSSEIKLKVIEDSDLNDRGFKRALMKELIEIEENSKVVR